MDSIQPPGIEMSLVKVRKTFFPLIFLYETCNEEVCISNLGILFHYTKPMLFLVIPHGKLVISPGSYSDSYGIVLSDFSFESFSLLYFGNFITIN